MAIGNLYISADTKYDPMSFEDFARPYMMYKQEFDKQQDALGELDTKASVWEGMADKEKDPVAYAKYKAYADNLREAAHSLATEGLSAGSRSRLMALRGDYSSRITPIENAYNRKKELSDEQRKMIAQNPTMLYQRMANNMSLDDFIANPQADYGQQYSGALLTQQVSQAAANLAKEARDSIEGKGKLYKILLPYQYEYVRQKGFDHKAVMQAIMDSPHADRILTGLVDSAVNTSGVLNWGDENTIRRAYDYARQGLYNAIGETQSQIIKDDFSATDELNRRQFERQDEKNKKSLLEKSRLALNPIALRAPKELDEWNKKLDKWIKKELIVKGKNGELALTEKGRDELGYKKITEKTPAKAGQAKQKLNTSGTASLAASMDASIGSGYNYNHRLVEKNKDFSDDMQSLFGIVLMADPTDDWLNTGTANFIASPDRRINFNNAAGVVVGAEKSGFAGMVNKEKNTPITNLYDWAQRFNEAKAKMPYSKWKQDAWKTDKNIPAKPDYGEMLNTLNSRMSESMKQHLEGSYDAYHSTEYGYQLTKEQGEAWMTAILADAYGRGKLDIVEFAGPDGFKKKDDIKLENLIEAGYTVRQVRPSKWGSTAILMPDKDSDEEPIRVSLPKGMNKRITDNYGKAIENADYWGNMVNNAMSDAERVLAADKQRDALDDLGSFVLGTVVEFAGSAPVRANTYY